MQKHNMAFPLSRRFWAFYYITRIEITLVAKNVFLIASAITT